ncbi:MULTISPECIES: helix-turn-helix domain-containing protein [Halobacteriales]|jgi:DNA-binding transcriptional ArsR family regulator|uniref:winged helix-turn-helix domain-containing protein n=1 Tax=Halobacteriales TaxID=2235 RepID=UPI000678BA49|nr:MULTISPECIES: helix-turn-helix domain-containing protein [Halobacteria]MDT3436872.1 helix-turn-helix domain-containing protein [Haloarcula sp. 1CSR25-25]
MGDDPATNEDPSPLQAVLDALDDPECQTILRETAEPMTAKELIERCDIPKSTVYRKLDLLSTASLVRERIEIHPEGGRITRYQRDFTDVTISMDDDDQIDVEISRPKRSADERLANIWSKMGDEL